jgi:poly(3-hydroxybutyrate) depolymerase
VERVRPAAITTTALMSVEGELDDISGSGQTRAVHDICTGVVSSERRHFEAQGAGHYGIFSGRRWREHVYPEVRAFIKSHQLSKAKAAPDAGASADDSGVPETPSMVKTARKSAVKKAPKSA